MAFNSTNASFPHEALEVSQQAARQAIATSEDPDTITMTGVVLTQPVPMSNADLRNFIGENPQSEATSTTTNNRIGKFFFKVRILAQGGFSPHEYLSDPCKLSTSAASNFNCIVDLIALHTTCISVGSYMGPRPKVGDLVEVELRKLTKGRSFWYNTQTAKFISIFDGSTRSAASTTVQQADCTSLEVLFETQDIQLTSGSGPTGIIDYTPSGTALPIPADVANRMNEKLSNAWEWLSPFLPANASLTSAVRTQADQDRIIRHYAGAANPPITGNLDEMLAQLRAGGFVIARRVSAPPHGHGGGGAFDISGGISGTSSRDYLDMIASAVISVHNDPTLKVQFLLFDNRGYRSIIEYTNGCVHVEVDTAEPPDPEAIALAIANIQEGSA